METPRLEVQLNRSKSHPTPDQPLWALIRDRTNAISPDRHADFVHAVLCKGEGETPQQRNMQRRLEELGPRLHGVAAYDILKYATQAFLLIECGADLESYRYPNDRHGETMGDHERPLMEESVRFGAPVTPHEITERLQRYLAGNHNTLPYLNHIVQTAFEGDHRTTSPYCFGLLKSQLAAPCLLELIWSYWHEEGMLVQSLNAISRRFQNMRAPGDRDPLSHLEIAPLRPINNLLWGYIQDEQNRLTLARRVNEYGHQYGLHLRGRAVPNGRTADSRTKFLEAFHRLLKMAIKFYKDDNDTTIIPDGFPLLNALRTLHLELAQGNHNQAGDLTWTARVEMLIQQWLIARPEIRDFLQSRAMVPYKERWMPSVDAMKTMQGWSDTTITHFRDLGVFGEQLLLSVRYGDWVRIEDEDAAKNWARYWRTEAYGYVNAYGAVTGVDLACDDRIDSTMPSLLLQKRLTEQRAR
jgi:hypothetical protein